MRAANCAVYNAVQSLSRYERAESTAECVIVIWAVDATLLRGLERDARPCTL